MVEISVVTHVGAKTPSGWEWRCRTAMKHAATTVPGRRAQPRLQGTHQHSFRFSRIGFPNSAAIYSLPAVSIGGTFRRDLYASSANKTLTS